jgi:CheY-like chemotaxis protein
MARILVIDDDEQVLGLLQAYLEDAGYEVIGASGGIEAMQLFRANPTDGVITDILMPGLDGLELIKELRQECPDVRILAISGGGINGPDLYLPTAHHLGALSTLAKPFEREELLQAVQNLLETP